MHYAVSPCCSFVAMLQRFPLPFAWYYSVYPDSWLSRSVKLLSFFFLFRRTGTSITGAEQLICYKTEGVLQHDYLSQLLQNLFKSSKNLLDANNNLPHGVHHLQLVIGQYRSSELLMFDLEWRIPSQPCVSRNKRLVHIYFQHITFRFSPRARSLVNRLFSCILDQLLCFMHSGPLTDSYSPIWKQ